jgi:hypothetical protein
MEEKPDFKTDHTHHDPAFCLALSLFRSVPKGKRQKLFLDMDYETTEATFHFESRHVLGVTEMRVMQGLIALASNNGPNGGRTVVGPEMLSKSGLEHNQTMELTNDGFDKDFITVASSFPKLAKEIGYANSSFNSGCQKKHLRTALERLWTVTVLVVYKDGSRRREGYHILSKYQSTSDGKFSVAINMRMAESIIGSRKFSRQEMAEIRALKTDPARFIHQRLCGWIDPGKDGRINIDTLCEYVWPKQALNINTIRARKRAIRKALGELTDLGWTVDEFVKGNFKILRRGLDN